MKKLVNRWKIPLVATVLSGFATVFALDYVAIDATVEPPEAVSVSGRVVSCERAGGGLLLSIEGGEDVYLAPVGLPEGADLSYTVLSPDGIPLVEGEGLFLPLSEVPGITTVYLFSPSGSVDFSSVSSVGVAAGAYGVSESSARVAAYASGATVAGAVRRSPPSLRTDASGVGRAVATPAGFEFHTPGVWTREKWGGTNAPPEFITSLSGFIGAYPNGEGAFDTGVSGLVYLEPDVTYSFRVGADDVATLSVGPLGLSKIYGEHPFLWGNEITGSVTNAGFYSCNVTFGTVGGPFELDFEENLGPLYGDSEIIPYAGLEPNPPELSFLRSDPAAFTQSSMLHVKGTNSNVTYYVEKESGPGSLTGSGTEWTYRVTKSELGASTNATATFRLTQTCGGAVWTNVTAKVSITSEGSLKPEVRDDCGCPLNGSKSDDDCVSFSQRFGTTPSADSAPWGSLAIEEELPNAALATPAVLRYIHPVERRLTGTASGWATVMPPLGHPVTYSDGVPAKRSSILDSRLVAGTWNDVAAVREVFSDRSEVIYTNGVPAALVTADGVAVAVRDLGIEVTRDANGAIRQLWSVTDGLMDVVPSGAGRFRVNWYAPAAVGAKDAATGLWTANGAPSKYFDFGTPEGGTAGRSFSLLEYRSDTLRFPVRWDWSDADGDWSMTRGTGGEAVFTSRSISFNGDGTWTVTKRRSSASGTVASETLTEYSSEYGIAPVSRTEGGRTVMTTARVAAGNGLGRPAAMTDSLGLSTATTYDAEGRPVRIDETGGPLARTTLCEYLAATEAGTPDFTPSRTVRMVGGVTNRIETYTREGSRSAGLTEVWTVSDGATVRTNMTVRYPASSANPFEAGRVALSVASDGTATSNEYAAAAGALYVHTATRGVFTDGAFATVDGRSTRTRRTVDARGDVVSEATDALVAGTWCELESSANTYNLIHQRLTTIRSNGKSYSSARICTGPVWEVGEDGIATTNAFDSVKRIASSARYGRHGTVTTLYVRDAADRIVSETRTAQGVESQTETTSYDAEGRVTSRTDAQGLTTTYAYSADGRTTTVTLPTGGTRITTLNADGSVASVTGTAVTAEFYTYGVTTNGLEWTKVNYLTPNGARWTKMYRNGFGETVLEERPGANGSILTTEYMYNAKGQLVSTTATAQPTETRTYDDFGDVASVTRSADGQTRTVETDSLYALDGGEVWRVASRRVSCSDATIPALVTTNRTQVSGLSLFNESRRVSIDVRGNTTTVWGEFDPATSTRTAYEAIPTATNVALTKETDGFATLSVSHSAVTNSASCDAYRRVVSTVDGRGNAITHAYDALGRLASVTDAANNTTTYAYDSVGRVAAITNALGIATTYKYDIRGNKVYEGGGTYPVTYAYDQFNVMTNMTTYRDYSGTGVPPVQSGDTTSWLYDDATGLLQQKLYADGHGVCYNYADDGKLLTRTWARGVTTTYTYDGWNQLANTTYSDNTPSVTLAYDAMGRQTSATDAAGMTSFSYTDYGEPLSETWGGLGNKTLLRHYDSFGRDTGYSVGGTRKTTIGYDAATGRLSTMNEGGNFTWNYLPGSDLKSRVVYPNGVAVDYTYEPNRDLLTNVKNYRGDTTYSEYAYENDALGRRTAKNAETYGYNDRNELISASTGYSYAYDDIGNRLTATELSTTSTYTANELNQYTLISGTGVPPVQNGVFTPTYDLDGNQTLVETSTGIWSVEYNGENRPVRWSRTNDNTVVTMDFDRMGRRTFYKEMKGNTQVTFTRFFYDGYLMIQQLFSNSPYNIYKEFIWDPTEPVATKPLCFRQNGKTATFYTHDGNKNVSDVISVSPYNQRTAHYEYAPFGEVTSAVGWRTTDNPYRFSSEFHDDTLGLVYYNYRHLNSDAGRWLQREPICEFKNYVFYKRYLKDNSKNFTHEYCFVFNDSQTYFDVGGLFPAGTDEDWGGWPMRFNKGNCWRYACNDPDSYKPMINPPTVVIDNSVDIAPFDCNSIKNAIVEKYASKGVEVISDSEDCSNCKYKVLLVIRPKTLYGPYKIVTLADNFTIPYDYHFYRQDTDVNCRFAGTWSHKQGAGCVQRNVVDPKQDAIANMYSTICPFYFCMPCRKDNQQPSIDLDSN